MGRTKHKPGIANVVPMLIVFLFVYVLSCGPAHWAYESGSLPEQAETALELVYYPVAWGVMNWPWFADWVMWYIEFWE